MAGSNATLPAARSPIAGSAAPNRLALVLFALALALLAAALPLGIGVEPAFGLVGWHLFAVVLATVGLLVAFHHPSNPIGWLLLGMAILQSLTELVEAYALRAAQNALPVGEVAEWVSTWIWIFSPMLLVLLLVLFPDGKLASQRWRIVPLLAFAGCASGVPGFALTPESEEFAGGENPLAVQGPLIDVLAAFGMACLLAALLAAAASLFVRFRHARGIERQQLKWVAFAAVVCALASGISAPLWPAWPAEALMLGGIFLIPIAAAIAILRYRLYDIDVAINRTLVYGALTATLALAYLGSVVLLQLALRPLTQESGLAVAASTLAVAALFRPARRRIQRIVDRRFYRRKYDAARTLERFGARLRDEVDLDALGADLRAVVNDTMQPAHVSLWLRTPAATGIAGAPSRRGT